MTTIHLQKHLPELSAFNDSPYPIHAQHSTGKHPLASFSPSLERFKRTIDLFALSHCWDYKSLIAIDSVHKSTRISKRVWRSLFFYQNQVYLKDHPEMPFPINCKSVYLQLEKFALSLHSDDPDCCDWIMKQAVASNYMEIVDLIAKYSPDSIYQTEDGKDTLLTQAVNHGNTHLALTLLKNGARTTDLILTYQYLKHVMPAAQCSNECTLLMIAIHEGYADIVRFLLQFGTDIEAQDRYGQTAFLHAVFMIFNMDHDDIVIRDHPYGVSLGIKKASNSPDNLLPIEILNILLEFRPNIDACDERGRSALMHAVLLKKVGMVKVLLKLLTIVGIQLSSMPREPIGNILRALSINSPQQIAKLKG